ncbi:AMP-binding protein [Nonomuraea lactucae]|uniref:AMP-binding protein n=1 Tax=Nonomuraea lactucae TaxID=2249762 RepID=UPI000DE302E0|nr:AMP-binding protein [Nonomuraea lactucae]
MNVVNEPSQLPASGLSYWPAEESQAAAEITVGDALRVAADRWGGRTALTAGLPGKPFRRWSFQDLLADSERVGRALLNLFAPGDRVAVWAGNVPEWILLEFGSALAGLTLVTVNPAYGSSELRYVVEQSEVSGLLVQPAHRSRDLLAIARNVVVDVPGVRHLLPLTMVNDFAGTASSSPLPEVRPTDIAQIQYTSGTTGFAKGAMLTHRGVVNNARLYAETIGANPNDVWINPMPLFHTAGCGLATLGALQTGGHHVLPPGFDAAVMLDLLESQRGTVTGNVPTMLIRMLDVQQAAPRDLSTWRLTTLGGAPVPPELVRRAESEARVTVAIGFGQTEASPYITHTQPDDAHPAWIETVGRPLPHVAVKVTDPETGNLQPIGEVGEICTRGICVMTGYYNNPQATAEALDDEGWLHTGDLGSMDDLGYLRVHGRLKDMIIRGGENVYPREIEDVLFEHPAIVNVAVLGLPDPEWGEVVAAFVETQPETQPDAVALAAYCRERLSGYKVPTVWEFVESFPMTTSGKIQKFALRDQHLTDFDATVAHS